MRPGPSFAVVLRQYYLMRGSVARLVPLFAWVTIDVVLWGFLTRYLSHITVPGFSAVRMLLGAVLMWDFFTRVMQGVTTTFFEDVWSRNFLNLFAAPITIGEYLGGLVISTILMSSIGLVVMLVLASLAFGFSFLALGAAIVPFMLVLFLFGIALGMIACAVVLRLGPSSEWFVWPIPMLLSPLVGVFYPLATLPPWLRAIGYALPPSYVFENMRAVVAGTGASLSGLAIGFALAASDLLLAGWIFARTHRHALQSGLIARYSAETVT
ncbi:MAG TPA: ABC transporter permease [Kofleriaceae bacterium]